MATNRGFNVAPRLLLSESMQRCKLNSCRGACCLYGVWLDEMEVQNLVENVKFIQPFMTNDVLNPDDWFDGRTDVDPFSHSGKVVHCTVLTDENHYGGMACVFLRDDHKCALQVAAVNQNLHPWSYKPFYCILHPLILDEEGQITLDDTASLLEESGSCMRPADHPIPLIETFEPELRYFLGNKKYTELLELARKSNS